MENPGNMKIIDGAQSVSIRKSNGALQQLERTKVHEYIGRGWQLDAVINIGNGVYNVVLSKD